MSVKTKKQVEYNYENESENYQLFYKSGAIVIMPYFLDPNHHKYIPIIGDTEKWQTNRPNYSIKINKEYMDKKYPDRKKYFADYLDRLAERKKTKICGHWGYTETPQNIYFCGTFRE